MGCPHRDVGDNSEMNVKVQKRGQEGMWGTGEFEES